MSTNNKAIEEMSLPGVRRHIISRLHHIQECIPLTSVNKTDVRLSVRFTDTGITGIAVFWGLSDYDPWHGDVCSAAELHASDDSTALEDIATQLLNDCADCMHL